MSHFIFILLSPCFVRPGLHMKLFQEQPIIPLINIKYSLTSTLGSRRKRSTAKGGHMEDLVHINDLLNLFGELLTNARNIHRFDNITTGLRWINRWCSSLDIDCTLCYQTLHVSLATTCLSRYYIILISPIHYYSGYHNASQNQVITTPQLCHFFFSILINFLLTLFQLLYFEIMCGQTRMNLGFIQEFFGYAFASIALHLYKISVTGSFGKFGLKCFVFHVIPSLLHTRIGGSFSCFKVDGSVNTYTVLPYSYIIIILYYY